MNYDEWNEVKKTINNKDFVSNAKIGKVYWVNVGLNIGCEIYGKGLRFCASCVSYKNFIY